jgi:hypothetical protein
VIEPEEQHFAVAMLQWRIAALPFALPFALLFALLFALPNQLHFLAPCHYV